MLGLPVYAELDQPCESYLHPSSIDLLNRVHAISDPSGNIRCLEEKFQPFFVKFTPNIPRKPIIL